MRTRYRACGVGAGVSTWARTPSATPSSAFPSDPEQRPSSDRENRKTGNNSTFLGASNLWVSQLRRVNAWTRGNDSSTESMGLFYVLSSTGSVFACSRREFLRHARRTNLSPMPNWKFLRVNFDYVHAAEIPPVRYVDSRWIDIERQDCLVVCTSLNVLGRRRSERLDYWENSAIRA